MELTHQFAVPGSVEQTWERFQDIGSLAECFPGAAVTEVEGDTFKGTVKVKLGPIALVYAGTGTFTEKNEAEHRLVVDAKGRDKRGNGTASATATLTMADSAAGGSTDVEVKTVLNVTGKPAQFGRGVMQDVSDKLLGQFTECLEKKSAPVADPSVEPADEGPVEPPSETPAPSVPVSGPATARESDDAIDLGATVGPAILKNYGRPILIGIAVIVVIILLFVLL